MIALLLSGCLAPWTMGGEETDGRFRASDRAVTVDGFAQDGGVDGDTAAPAARDLRVTVDADGAHVAHDFSAPCDAELSGASAVIDGATVTVTYTGTAGSDMSGTCDVSLSYTLTGLDPGDWTLVAEGDTASFTVPE